MTTANMFPNVSEEEMRLEGERLEAASLAFRERIKNEQDPPVYSNHEEKCPDTVGAFTESEAGDHVFDLFIPLLKKDVR